MDPLNEVDEKSQCEKVALPTILYLEYKIKRFYSDEDSGAFSVLKSIPYSMQIHISTIIENATK